MVLNWKPRRFHNFHFSVIRFYMFSISFAVIHRFLWKIVRANLQRDQSIGVNWFRSIKSSIHTKLFIWPREYWLVCQTGQQQKMLKMKVKLWRWKALPLLWTIQFGLWKWNDWRRNIQSIAKFLQALCNGYKVNVGIHTCADKSAADRIYAHCH